jgi:cell fate regulator YaaT (PSP1 superfamily)
MDAAPPVRRVQSVMQETEPMATTAFIRYGIMDKTEAFSAPDNALQVDSDVIIRTQRGVEWGHVVLLQQQKPGKGRMAGEVLRKATAADEEKHSDILDRQEAEELKCCRKLIKEHELPMKLVGVEHLFGGTKIIFYFLAEGRIDFRELVKDLAKRYRTRIEMRQIGVRDEARLMGQLGPCGKELCCRTFLNALKPVPMKLAKDQKSTLDPAKISGTCGRLKCCLKFEEDLYREFKRNLPRRGVRVKTPQGDGVVVDYEIITQTVEVELRKGERQKFSVEELQFDSER